MYIDERSSNSSRVPSAHILFCRLRSLKRENKRGEVEVVKS
jgi:hypothetical protein